MCLKVPDDAKKALLSDPEGFLIFINKVQDKEINLSDFEVLQPWAIAAIAAIARKENPHRVNIIHNSASSASRFAYSLGLFDIAKGLLAHGVPEKGRTVKLSRVNKFPDIEHISYAISKLIIDNSTSDKIEDQYIDAEEIRRTIYYVMVEMIRNVLQHSGDKWGATLIAQSMYEYGDPCIQIAVVDLGIGIYNSLKKTRHDIENNRVALERALWPYYSGAFYDFQKGSSQNAGLGLFFVSEMAKLTGGRLMISSKNATLCIQGDPEGGVNNHINFLETGFPGTLVVFEIPKRGLADHDEIIKTITARAEERLPGKIHKSHISYETPPKECYEFLVRLASEDTAKAEAFNKKHILPRLQKKIPVTLNFLGLSVCTQSFIHALLFDPLVLAKQLDVEIYITNASFSIKDGIKLLEMYALRE